jgi:hypothetical protein
MKCKMEGTFEILSAILVLFTSMLNPWISIVLSVTLLVIFGFYKFLKK